MLDRASAFDDPRVVRLVRERFVPVALDVWYAERAQDEDGRFYRRVVTQRPGLVPGRTTQGFYAATPDGALLEGWNHRGVDRLLDRLRAALDRKPPPPPAAAAAPGEPPPDADASFARRVPEGAAVADVFARIVEAKWPPSTSAFDDAFRAATGRDHLWILAEEQRALLEGRFPAPLLRRLARFHLVDDTRGEPPMWTSGEVGAVEATLAESGGGFDVVGKASLRTADGARSYEARLFGRVEGSEGRLARFDLLATGAFRGEGRFTGGAPPGEFTLAVAVRLARADDPMRAVPPQGARELRAYLAP